MPAANYQNGQTGAISLIGVDIKKLDAVLDSNKIIAGKPSDLQTDGAISSEYYERKNLGENINLGTALETNGKRAFFEMQTKGFRGFGASFFVTTIDKARYYSNQSSTTISAVLYSNDLNPVKSNSWFGNSYIGLNVKLPLLTGEDKKNKIEQLQLQSQQYSDQLDNKSAELNQEYLTATLKLTRLNFQLKTLDDNIILYQENLKIFQERFQEQQVTSIKLNRQEYELQNLLSDYRNTKAKAWLCKLAILNATGHLANYGTDVK